MSGLTPRKYVAPSFKLSVCGRHFHIRFKHRYFLTFYRNVFTKEHCAVCTHEKRPGGFPPVWVIG